AAGGGLGGATPLAAAGTWNAAVASGRPPADLAAPFDLVGVAFSKGLGAPGGSMLAGSAETIATATRYRRMAGGARRQAGVFPAAAPHPPAQPPRPPAPRPARTTTPTPASSPSGWPQARSRTSTSTSSRRTSC